MHSWRLRQDSVFLSGRYENNEMLCSTCLGWDGQRLQQKVQYQGLQYTTVVRNVRYESGRVLYTACLGWDGHRL